MRLKALWEQRILNVQSVLWNPSPKRPLPLLVPAFILSVFHAYVNGPRYNKFSKTVNKTFVKHYSFPGEIGMSTM